MNLDTLLELAEAESFGETYLKHAGKTILPVVLRQRCTHRRAHNRSRLTIHILNRNPRWTPAERDYLAAHIGIQNDEQIAAALGRSPNSIKIKRQRWNLPAHSKRPGYLTGNTIARILGVDIHAICKMHNRGLIPTKRLAGARGILVIHQTTFYRWAINPNNWIYFKPQRVTDLHLRRLIQLKTARWNDQWWSVGQVAAHHKVKEGTVGAAIYYGRLPAVRWGNYYVLRSNAIKHHFWTGKGHGHEIDWAPAVDKFILLATAVGLTSHSIEIQTGISHKRISHRLHQLRATCEIPAIIAASGIQYNPTTKQIHINLQQVSYRFPALTKTIEHFKKGKQLTKTQTLLTRAYLAHLLDWHNLPGPRMVSVGKWSPDIVLDRLCQMAATLEKHGVQIA